MSAKKQKTEPSKTESDSLLFCETTSDKEICIIEPFYGGSHKQLIDLIESELKISNRKYDLFTMPAKKWHWRARCSALYFSQIIPKHNYKIIFASSVLNLAEFIALRQDLASAKKVIYFHENQLTYPVRQQTTRNKIQIENKEQRDFQYGYNQILTSLVADRNLFNSNYNKTTFLESINKFLKQMPDHFVKINTKNDLEPKCFVSYFPINICENLINSITIETSMSQMITYLNHEAYLNRPINILWSNRWEHDKNPDEFFNVLFKLDEMKIDFRLHVIGEQFNQVPEIFEIAKEKLKSKIENWGYMQSKHDYFKALSQCDLVVSTSLHEFYGVALIEACLFGVYPLLPNRLVYPELYPKLCLYSTEAQLVKKLKYICSRPKWFRLARQKHSLDKNQSNAINKNNDSNEISELIDKPGYFDKFKWSTLKSEFISQCFSF